MDINYIDANNIVIKSKNGIIISDPIDDVKRIKELKNPESITLITQDDFTPIEASFIINMPGEYEKHNISIKGIPIQKFGEKDSKNGVMYALTIEGVRIALTGHINSPISDDDLESLGVVDIVVIPVDGGELSLNARDAASIVRQLDPKIVIPTCYSTDSKQQDELDEFLKELSGFAHEKIDSLKIKNAQMPPVTTIYTLKKK